MATLVHQTVGGKDANGNRVEMLVTSSGALAVSETGGTSVSVTATTAYATNKVVKASAGTLWSLWVFNSKASSQWVQVHNAASLPADTAVPLGIFYLAANTGILADWGDGLPCSTGIVICNSSTGPTKTIGSADIFVTATYT